jgi:hypothetical protein
VKQLKNAFSKAPGEWPIGTPKQEAVYALVTRRTSRRAMAAGVQQDWQTLAW